MFDMQDSRPYWRRTPPAVFPPIMGLFGLTLAWRRAAEVYALPEAISDLILGAVTLVYLFAAGSYLAKVLARPGVVAEEIRILPGLTGVSAMTLSGVLLAAGLVPFMPALARGLLVVFLALHAGVAILAASWFLRCPPEARRVAPSWHLTFIGFILAPFAAIPLEMNTLALVCFWGPMPVIAAIYAASLWQMSRSDTPAPLRPLLVIHMAPFAVQATVAMALGMTVLAQVLACGALVLAVIFAVRLPWLTKAGFSPFWGAFTFPLAALASAGITVSVSLAPFGWAGLVALVSATVVVPAIAIRVMQAWARGVLAAKTNAAVA